MPVFKLKALECKKQMLLKRVNKLLDQSKKVSPTTDSRSTENFMADSETIDDTRSEFNSLIDEINQVSSQINPAFVPDYESLDEFDEKYSRIKRMRNNVISSQKTVATPTTPSVSQKPIVKLPPIEIPSFDGKTENWSIFYESFRTNIHENPQLSDSQRVQYLVGKLTQNALKVVAGIVPTGDTYKIIWSALVKKYQDKRALGTYYLNNILDLKNTAHSASSLNLFIETFSASIAALKQLGIEDISDFLLLHCALKKVDAYTVQAFELSVRSMEIPSCNEFIAFVQDQVKILERSNNSNVTYTPRNLAQKTEPTTRTYKTFLTGETTNACLMCQSTDHMIFNCNQFKNLGSPQSRFDFIKAKNACVNCLSAVHMISNCNSKHVCNHCQRKHHTLLHFNKNISSNSNNNLAPVQLHTYIQENERNSTLDEPSGHAHETNIQPCVNDGTVASSSHGAHAIVEPVTTSACDVTPGTTLSLIAKSKPRTTILLSTVQAYAYNKNEDRRLIRLLLDNGSQNNLITLECCKSLNLPVTPLFNSSLKGVGLTSRPIHGFVHLTVESRVTTDKYYIEALVVDTITDKLPAREIDLTDVNISTEVPLADLTWNLPGCVDLVLGAQLFPFIYLGDRIAMHSSLPPAFRTTFGYVLMGDVPVPTLVSESEHSAPFTAFTMSELNTTLHKFWELEELPNKRYYSPEEFECENAFIKSVTRDADGRYSVELPFCKDPEGLGNSHAVAQRRFSALERKFKHSPEFRNEYNNVITEYIKNGYLSEVTTDQPEGEGYYIPHHAVIRQDKSTSKLRIVLDASAKTHTGLSLNDVLHTGPNLQANLFLMLLDFRLFPIALTADIKQMYLQIVTPEAHRKYLKMLFRFSDNEKLRTYNFNRTPFGLKSSPFIAMRTVHQLAIDEANRFPEAAAIAQTKLYMDDLVTSISDLDTAKRLAKELIALFKSGCFDLVKWASNSTALLESLPHSHRAPVNFADDNSHLAVLGLTWIPHQDNFQFITTDTTDKCTKRSILSFVARLFDVLGLVGPVVVYAKLLIKDLWAQKVDWDEQPPETTKKSFLALTSELPLLSDIEIPRHVGASSDQSVNIVAFCDASLKAYGCVVYIHVTDKAGNVIGRLLCSKSKVSPVKVTTLARLELCAAVLMSRLIKTVLDTYSPRISIKDVYAFSDSTIALSWVNSSPHRWSIFVSNRIAQFQENLDPRKMYHISGKDNPSDCLSRGLLPSQLIGNNLWWHGPSWMHTHVSDWPVKPFAPHKDEELPELKATSLLCSAQTTDHVLYECAKRISSWNKLLRVMVYVLRFVKRLPRARTISANDLIVAEKEILKSVQNFHFCEDISTIKSGGAPSKRLRKLSPFIDEENILRIEGRLSKSDLPFEAKHPALLPKRDHVVDIIIDHYHKNNLHAGANLLMSIIRQRFWILSARNIIRKRVLMCNRCFSLSPSHPSPKMADLPAYRVAETKAFVHTGVDYAGPIRITLSRRRGQHAQKAFICLFVCLNTKAINIQLVSDLTTESFLAAFKRFISCRGPVTCIYSDNGTNFVGAKAKLDEMYNFVQSSSYQEALSNELANCRIQWKMIPPRAPHFGGIWEANIKSVKTHLFRVIGTQLLTYEELLTVLMQVEGLLNSRPLCVLASEPEPEVLTPAHFLMATPLKYLPMTDLSHERVNLTDRKKLLDLLVTSYWKKWRMEYLHTLQVRQKWCTPSNPVTVGTVVLIDQDDVPPLRWPMGIIEQVCPGSDGVVRVAIVKTKGGTLKRPVVKLYPLPTQ